MHEDDLDTPRKFSFAMRTPTPEAEEIPEQTDPDPDGQAGYGVTVRVRESVWDLEEGEEAATDLHSEEGVLPRSELLRRFNICINKEFLTPGMKPRTLKATTDLFNLVERFVMEQSNAHRRVPAFGGSFTHSVKKERFFLAPKFEVVKGDISGTYKEEHTVISHRRYMSGSPRKIVIMKDADGGNKAGVLDDNGDFKEDRSLEDIVRRYEEYEAEVAQKRRVSDDRPGSDPALEDGDDE